MRNPRVILVCDNDQETLQAIQRSIGKEGYDVVSIDDASVLIENALRLNPGVILVNPDMKAFNEYDVCNKLMQKMKIPVILLLDPNSTTRAQIDKCMIEDVMTRPIEMDNLSNLIAKNITVVQRH
jgi:DNA-binding response OmpR family regulator